MIPRTHRFHGQNSLSYVYRHGQTVRGPFFAIKSVFNARTRNYRLAVVVSRKVHKSAVVRNRMRRRLHEAFRLMEDDISGPYDIVVTVFHSSMLEQSPKSLASQLKKQLKSSGVLGSRLKDQSN